MKTRARPVLLAAAAAAAAALASACGADDRIDRGTSSQPAADQPAPSADATAPGGDEAVAIDHLVIPPKGYYDALFADALSAVDNPAALALADQTVPQVLWVNFAGAQLTKGFARNQSFILCKAQATVPPAGVSPAEETAIVELVKNHFTTAGARLVVTTQKPSAGDYTTIHVGGSYADLGCVGAGVLGVAPFDDGNANRNDVGFAFTKGVQSARVIAETVSHEAAHSFGLEHVTDNRDLMFASSSPAITGFGVARVQGAARTQDGPAKLQGALGKADGSMGPIATVPTPQQPQPQQPQQPQQPTPQQPPIAIPGLPNLPPALAGLPGLAQLANIGALLQGLGGAGALDITKLLPLLQGLFPGGAGALPGLDKIIAIIGLGGLAGNGGAQQPVAGLPGNLGTLLGSLLGGAAGGGATSPLKGLTDLLAQAGFGNLDQALQALQGILNGGGAGGGAIGLPQGLPDLAQLLGLLQGGAGGIPDIAALIKNLLGSATVVSGNFQGADKDALLSLLKVAYAQQYSQLGGLQTQP